MSGRLIILPKKSWHVWNRENVEKVKRDERIDREEKSKKEIEARSAYQESTLTTLQKRAETVSLINSTDKSLSTSSVQPFRLFEDIEKLSQTHPSGARGNAEYIKEKEVADLAQKTREGLAPWGLGEGSAESSSVKPWYHYLPGETEREKEKWGLGEGSAESSSVKPW
eukprot:CAMPEP_0182438894 /NCGR_PEP_ID=MMETSP1167-20130531/86087_1 /TAXON_ID=2988 /ORGANISM="Mallomonas Sp, Strain CCMP3275" /LENGTH=167 /DNA_ID=CAMNT_0024632437 /DNA_START=89 /DNA_END=589 /DNA_ORIENTATION=-